MCTRISFSLSMQFNRFRILLFLFLFLFSFKSSGEFVFDVCDEVGLFDFDTDRFVR